MKQLPEAAVVIYLGYARLVYGKEFIYCSLCTCFRKRSE